MRRLCGYIISFEQPGALAGVTSVDAVRENDFRLKRKSYDLAIDMHSADNMLELSKQITNYYFALFHHDIVSHPAPPLTAPINHLRACNMSEYMLNITSFPETEKDSPDDVFPERLMRG